PRRRDADELAAGTAGAADGSGGGAARPRLSPSVRRRDPGRTAGLFRESPPVPCAARTGERFSCGRKIRRGKAWTRLPYGFPTFVRPGRSSCAGEGGRSQWPVETLLEIGCYTAARREGAVPPQGKDEDP